MVVLGDSRRGDRLGLTCHRAAISRASSAKTVEEAFFLALRFFEVVDRPLVCVTVTAPTTAGLRQRRDEVADADLLELRLDSVSDPDLAGALAGRRRPVIVTCRPAWEGGGFKGSEEERRRLLTDALALGAEYVDLEWRAHFDDLLARTGGRRIVLSAHDFRSMPRGLAELARAMRATGAEVVKIAAQANALRDCLPLLELGRNMGQQGRMVLIAMGERGLASRVLAGRFGSAWTYAGTVGEVGQLRPCVLLDDYRFRALSAVTDVYGVVGSPVSHSVSPAMHNAAFRAGGIDAVYLPLPAVDVDDFITFARGIGLKGASVTIPFKVPLFERVDEACTAAHRIGAINTIRVVDGRWLGANTDAAGFLQPLQDRGVSVRGMRAAILGAGGSARAVAIALATSGAVVSVHARSQARAEAVAMLASGGAGAWPPEPGSWDLLINCTPIGMHPRVDETPLPLEALTGRLVYDLVYNPPATRLLREAAASGIATIGGMDMLVAQAHEQFQGWIGTRPPPGVMRTAAEQGLRRFTADENHLA
jgi:3-dehydroquinate dehydratase/shikimate dehydrogenase